ncbi:spinster family MFS transporter [Marinobacterium mangrovicola]|uniref:Putative MFS family arabinose efflux permease n=1 Tax=Marinobacterium mangrovicola TaxID=1476959 RepID=A0A4R1GJJ3_9GAMM|nr:MFS transporter [Marinobacterium mangrovicola]TCK07350.1 putative MFS family arabinose efflux permease [Marinobacterium mangrovicola]
MLAAKAELNQERAVERKTLYPWYIVALCTLGYVFSFLDRQVITLLIEPIKADLQITDTQFSLVTGLAFALFYAFMGLPIARWADTRSRPMIIACGIFVWSLATAVCGLAKSFGQLFFARMAVGCGEAALSPAAYSMITDAFPKHRVGMALGVYSSGSFLGAALAFIIGGAAIEYISSLGEVSLPVVGVMKPWQLTFWIVGLPGVLLALMFAITVKDPERKGEVRAKGYTLGEVGAYMKANLGTFASIYVGFSLLALTLYALMSWGPAYLLRNYELSMSQVGVYLGVVALVANASGVLTSGWLVDFFTRKGHDDAAMRAGMVGGLGVIIPALIFPFVDSLLGTLCVYALTMYFASFPMATSAAALQNIAPNQMRAQVTALFFVGMNMLGITCGSTLVALLTDYVFEDPAAVGHSMSVVAAGSAMLAAFCLRTGLKHCRGTIASLVD